MKFILFKGRHSHPEIDGLPAIFTEDVDPMDFWMMSRTAFKRINDAKAEHIDLYCTGLTQATCAVIDACIRAGVSLTLWHYDKSEDDYKPQRITIPTAEPAA